MRVIIGTVVDGKVIIDGEPLVDGTTVTVLAREDGDSFELSADDERDLLLAIEEADRGNTVSVDEALRLIRRSD